MAEISNSIGRDNYGDIVQAGGDANVTKVTGAGDPLDALIAVRRLRAALGDAELDPGARASAAAAIDEVEAELRRPEPDREKVGGRLERLTSLLEAGGVLLSAGVAFADPIGTIARWVGSALR